MSLRRSLRKLERAYQGEAVEGNAEPTEEEEAALRRYEGIKEEVRSELETQTREPGG
jgi:hypothetical protein